MLKTIKLDDARLWDKIVDSFDDSTVYFTNGYARAVSTITDGEILLFYFEGKSMKAMNVACKREIDGTNFYDLCSIAGFCGWITEGENEDDLRLLSVAIEAYASGEGIVSEFIRCNPQIPSSMYECFGRKRQIGHSVIMDISNEDDIWTNMRASNRNCIRKSYNYGVTVSFDVWATEIDEFKRIYNDTMSRKKAYEYIFPDEYYDELLAIRNADVFLAHAEYNGVIVSSAVFFGKNRKAYYHLSGSDEDYAFLGSMRAVIYEAACLLSNLGYKTLDLGGGVKSRNDSLLEFKKRFVKHDATPFFVLDKIYNIQEYNALCKADSAGDFFPAYRR
jgi:hypothetical protein